MTTSIHPMSSPGLASMAPNTSATCSGTSPLKVPAPIFTTKASIQPPTVV